MTQEGIDYTNRNFRNADGTTRILYLWDQTLDREFTARQIDEALAAGSASEAQRLVPSFDASGHGTTVAGIAAGNGNLSPLYEGMAPQSTLIVVKLGVARTDSFPRTTELMRALNYAVKKAVELQMPLAVNLSFGNTYGAHDGTSLLERFIDNVSEVGRCVVCIGSGNEGASAGHVTGSFLPGDTAAKRIELAIGSYELNMNVQLWKNYADRLSLTVISPSGVSREIPTVGQGRYVVEADGTQLLIYVGEPVPYSVNQEIYIDFLPSQRYIASGVWTFVLTPERIRSGTFAFYLPSESARNQQTRFYSPEPDVTLTIPSTSRKSVTVGAYDTVYDAYADFSGRGYPYTDRMARAMFQVDVKPDLVAPGVNIATYGVKENPVTVSGTSYAAPFVTGAAALMMEWGIVQGNDPFLYGEKVKAYLHRGARPIRGESEYPNARAGYGALCVAESLPI